MRRWTLGLTLLLALACHLPSAWSLSLSGGSSGALPTVSCPDTGGNHLNFNAGVYTCGSSSSGGTPGNALADGVTKGIATFSPEFLDNGSGLISLATTLVSHILGPTNTFTPRDDRFTLQDDGDATKQIRFQLSGITAGQIRLLTPPNFDGTLATLAGTETLTGKTLSGASNTITNLPETALAFTDVTARNATTSAHGLLPKLPGGTTAFLREDGTFAVPPGGGSSAFATLTSGTNTTAAMLVGSGASLTPTGTGVIDATTLGGVAASSYPTLTSASILTNKQIVLRVVAQTVSSNAFTVNIDTTDVAVVPALSAGVTVNAPSATGSNPREYQEFDIVFSPSAAPQTITWSASFAARAGLALPGSVTGDNTTYDVVRVRYFPVIAKYVIMATTIGAEPGVTTLASSTTFTPPSDTSSRVEMQMTGATGTITMAAPTGTPVNGKLLWLALQCTNLQTLSWNAAYLNGVHQIKPPTCPAGVTSWLEVLVRYSSVESGWVVLVGAPAATTPTFTVTKNLPVTGVKFPATNPGRLDRSGNTDKLLFDATTAQCVHWQFLWPTDATAGGSIKLNASAASATTGSINFDLSVWKVTPGASVDVDTESYDTANTCNTATVPGTAGFPFTVSCTLTTKDSVVAGDNTLLKLCRNIGDTATGDAEVELVELQFTH